jgi:hypothetical protein
MSKPAHIIDNYKFNQTIEEHISMICNPGVKQSIALNVSLYEPIWSRDSR